MIYRFADLKLDSGRRLLTRNGQVVALTKLCFDVLKVLVEAAPDLVSHDEMTDRVWGPDRVITPENLAQRIHILRDSLGDDAANPTYIDGVRGQGFRLIPQVEVDAPGPETASRSKRRLWLGAGIAIAVVGVVIMWTVLDHRVEPVDAPDPQSIAVLPFKNIGGNADNEYMAEGIAEELMNALAHVPELRVTAQTSSFAFKDQAVDIRTIAEKLGVAHVLEGSVRVSGNKLRVTAQLIDSGDGTHEWSETYDHELQDVFAIQDDITKNVVSSLAMTLGVTLEVPVPGGSTRNMEAFTHFLRGNDWMRNFEVDREEACLEAIAHLQVAVQLDPQFGDAYASLADAYICARNVYRVRSGDIDRASEMESKALSSAEMAVSVSPDSSEAFRALAVLHGDDEPQERALLRRAVQLDPSNVRAMVQLAVDIMVEDPEEALRLSREVMKLDPASWAATFLLAEALMRAGQLKEAADVYLLGATIRRGSLYSIIQNRENVAEAAKGLKEVPGNINFRHGTNGWRVCEECGQSAAISTVRLKGLTRQVGVLSSSVPSTDVWRCYVSNEFLARPYHDKYIRFVGRLKTQGVGARAYIGMRMDGHDDMVNFRDGRYEPVRDNSEWLARQTRLYVPEEAVIINIAVLLEGIGEVWVDNLWVEVADNPDFENAIRIGEFN